MTATDRPRHSPKKHGRRYPWPEWFDRKLRVLVRGRDFDCEPSSMGIMARLAASRRKYPATVLVAGETVVINPTTA